MERKALYLSLALHGVVLTLMLGNFHFATDYSKPPAAVMMVDLTKVKIADKTNLPQKSVPKKEVKKVPPKPVETKTQPTSVVSKPKTPVQPKPVQPKTIPVKNAVPVESPKKEVVPEPIQKKPDVQRTQVNDDLQSLLASVEKVRKKPTAVVEDTAVNQEGIGFGLEGRLDQMLTISEKDFISSKLRECWNIDGGAQDLDEIFVEVQTFINKDGSVREVNILNTQSYPAFQSIADSARRAIYICANKGVDSPFYVLATKYANHYSDWKEIDLRFSPTQGIY